MSLLRTIYAANHIVHIWYVDAREVWCRYRISFARIRLQAVHEIGNLAYWVTLRLLVNCFKKTWILVEFFRSRFLVIFETCRFISDRLAFAGMAFTVTWWRKNLVQLKWPRTIFYIWITFLFGQIQSKRLVWIVFKVTWISKEHSLRR